MLTKKKERTNHNCIKVAKNDTKSLLFKRVSMLTLSSLNLCSTLVLFYSLLLFFQ